MGGLFCWLAGGPRSADAFLRDLESSNSDIRWRTASDLAQVAEACATVNTFLAFQKSAQAQIEEATANLQAAKLNESYTEIRAPEDGWVTPESG